MTPGDRVAQLYPWALGKHDIIVMIYGSSNLIYYKVAKVFVFREVLYFKNHTEVMELLIPLHTTLLLPFLY
jgi:hypothetical protein